MNITDNINPIIILINPANVLANATSRKNADALNHTVHTKQQTSKYYLSF
jgi:hypothetical protein